MLSIARPSVWPPGGYSYTQPETGMQFGGNEQFKPQCFAILAHRKGNHLPRATYEQVAEDVVAAICQRLPGVCVETTVSPVTQEINRRKAAELPCSTCGGRKA